MSQTPPTVFNLLHMIPMPFRCACSNSYFLFTFIFIIISLTVHPCLTCLLLSMYCSLLYIDERVWWMYMFVYTLYKLSMSVKEYVFVWKCKLFACVQWTCVVYMKKCCIVHMFGWRQGRYVVNLLGHHI